MYYTPTTPDEPDSIPKFEIRYFQQTHKVSNSETYLLFLCHGVVRRVRVPEYLRAVRINEWYEYRYRGSYILVLNRKVCSKLDQS